MKWARLGKIALCILSFSAFSMGEDWRGHRSALKGFQRGI